MDKEQKSTDVENIESQLAQLKVRLLPPVRVLSRRMFWREYLAVQIVSDIGGMAHCTMLSSERQASSDMGMKLG